MALISFPIYPCDTAVVSNLCRPSGSLPDCVTSAETFVASSLQPAVGVCPWSDERCASGADLLNAARFPETIKPMTRLQVDQSTCFPPSAELGCSAPVFCLLVPPHCGYFFNISSFFYTSCYVSGRLSRCVHQFLLKLGVCRFSLCLTAHLLIVLSPFPSRCHSFYLSPRTHSAILLATSAPSDICSACFCPRNLKASSQSHSQVSPRAKAAP